ncbi:hypothetical protein [Kordia sp.]|uniref:hypothetical protein n=1 Tax=Kordia sp. TaxID=1965332 RepID=UPI003D29192D
MKKLSLFTLLLILVSSCSSKLTKEEAATVIKEYFPQYCTSKRITKHSYSYARYGTDKEDREALKIFRNLEKQGLVNVKLSITGITSNPDKDYSITPTSQSLDTYGAGFPITKMTFSEIVAISQTENEAIVRYKVKNEETPYHTLHVHKNTYSSKKRYDCDKTEWEQEVTLIKFDDGWRLKK